MKNTYDKIGSTMIEQTSVYGPPPEEVYTIDTNTINGNNKGQENNNLALTITNIIVSAVLIILGVLAIFSKKLSKTSKIVVVVGLIIIGVLIIFLINNIPNIGK